MISLNLADFVLVALSAVVGAGMAIDSYFQSTGGSSSSIGDRLMMVVVAIVILAVGMWLAGMIASASPLVAILAILTFGLLFLAAIKIAFIAGLGGVAGAIVGAVLCGVYRLAYYVWLHPKSILFLFVFGIFGTIWLLGASNRKR